MRFFSSQATFKSQFKKSLWGLLALYLLIFSYRLINGYFRSDESVANSSNFNFSFSRKNYAGYHFKSKGDFDSKFDPKGGGGSDVTGEADVAGESGSVSSEQKYERIATLTNTTLSYTEDEKKLYDKINHYKALVQYETKEGLNGERRLSLAIGVQPVRFDEMVEALKTIGKNTALEINKVDKTTEFKELNARKRSLEKSRNALIDLKRNNGSLADFVQLEEKILEIEKKIQEMGVQLGNFDSENEFCTIKFSIFEGNSPLKISFLHRVKVALLWTTQIYAGMLGFALLFLSVALVGVLVLRIVLKEVEKYNNKG